MALSGLSMEVMRLRGQNPPWAHWSWLAMPSLTCLARRPANRPRSILSCGGRTS